MYTRESSVGSQMSHFGRLRVNNPDSDIESDADTSSAGHGKGSEQITNTLHPLSDLRVLATLDNDAFLRVDLTGCCSASDIRNIIINRLLPAAHGERDRTTEDRGWDFYHGGKSEPLTDVSLWDLCCAHDSRQHRQQPQSSTLEIFAQRNQHLTEQNILHARRSNSSEVPTLRPEQMTRYFSSNSDPSTPAARNFGNPESIPTASIASSVVPQTELCTKGPENIHEVFSNEPSDSPLHHNLTPEELRLQKQALQQIEQQFQDQAMAHREQEAERRRWLAQQQQHERHVPHDNANTLYQRSSSNDFSPASPAPAHDPRLRYKTLPNHPTPRISGSPSQRPTWPAVNSDGVVGTTRAYARASLDIHRSPGNLPPIMNSPPMPFVSSPTTSPVLHRPYSASSLGFSSPVSPIARIPPSLHSPAAAFHTVHPQSPSMSQSGHHRKVMTHQGPQPSHGGIRPGSLAAFPEHRSEYSSRIAQASTSTFAGGFVNPQLTYMKHPFAGPETRAPASDRSDLHFRRNSSESQVNVDDALRPHKLRKPASQSILSSRQSERGGQQFPQTPSYVVSPGNHPETLSGANGSRGPVSYGYGSSQYNPTRPHERVPRQASDGDTSIARPHTLHGERLHALEHSPRDLTQRPMSAYEHGTQPPAKPSIADKLSGGFVELANDKIRFTSNVQAPKANHQSSFVHNPSQEPGHTPDLSPLSFPKPVSSPISPRILPPNNNQNPSNTIPRTVRLSTSHSSGAEDQTNRSVWDQLLEDQAVSDDFPEFPDFEDDIHSVGNTWIKTPKDTLDQPESNSGSRATNSLPRLQIPLSPHASAQTSSQQSQTSLHFPHKVQIRDQPDWPEDEQDSAQVSADHLGTDSSRPLAELKEIPERQNSFRKKENTTLNRPHVQEIYQHIDEFFKKADLDQAIDVPDPNLLCSTNHLPRFDNDATGNLRRVVPRRSVRLAAHEQKALLARREVRKHTQPVGMIRRASTRLWGTKALEVKATATKSPAIAGSEVVPWIKGDLIGKGTYGRVYLAMHAVTGEMFAVKQVELPSTSADREDTRLASMVKSLRDEIELLKDLRHKHVVEYLGFEEKTEVLNLWLEYVPGGSVGRAVRRHGRMYENNVKSITEQTLSGLSYLHSKGILHRDMKADNLLIDLEGNIKISDFGVSKHTESIYDNDTGMSMQGSVFWMAPEVVNSVFQEKRLGYSAKADCWGIGCIVLECFAGRRPWSNTEAVAAMLQLGSTRSAPPIPDDIKLSTVAQEFLNLCWKADPELRPTAEQLLAHSFTELPEHWTFQESPLALVWTK